MPNCKTTYTDQELYSYIQKGDEKAYEIFFLRHYPTLCSYANQFVELEDGQEIVQEVMIWLWENRDMPFMELSPKSYLYKAVKNKCITLIHRGEMKQRIFNAIHTELQEQYEDPDFYVVEELTKKIESALGALSESYREAFEMNRFKNMTYNEIALQLNISAKTVDYRIQQALKQLRIDLKDYLPLAFLI